MENRQDQQPLRKLPLGSMNLDSAPERLSPGEVRLVVNATPGDRGGDTDTRVDELGNVPVFDHAPGDQVCGSIQIENRGHVVFTRNLAESHSSIYLVPTGTDASELLVRSSGLDFRPEWPIRGEWSVVAGCRINVYWADGYNTDRYLDLDELDRFTERETVANGPSDALAPVGQTVANADDRWDVDSMSLVSLVGRPSIAKADILDYGGELPIGQYKFAVECIDADGNALSRSEYSRPVIITASGDNQAYSTTTGGYAQTETAGDTRFGVYPPVTRAIRLRVIDLSDLAARVRLYVARAVTGDGVTWEAFRIAAEQPVTDDTLEITFGGLKPNEGDAAVDIEATLPLLPDWETSLAMAIGRDRLYRMNLSRRAPDMRILQQVASKMFVTYEVIERPDSEVVTGNEKSGETPFDLTTEVADEVICLGIQFEVEGRYWTPVSTIPGRPRNYDPVTNTELPAAAWDDVNSLNGYANRLQPPKGSQPGGYDDMPLTWVDHEKDVDWYADSAADYERKGELERWNVFSTSYAFDDNEGLLGYHEVAGAVYPYVEPDANGVDVWGVDCKGEALQGTPIRHHRIPDRASVHAHEILNRTSSSGVSYRYLAPENYDAGLYEKIEVTVNWIEDGQAQTSTFVVKDINDPAFEAPEDNIFTEVAEGVVVNAITVSYEGTLPDQTTVTEAGTFDSASVETSGTSGRVRLIGLRFHGLGIRYPEMPNGLKITGHRFVKAEVDVTQRTCVDSGMMVNMQHHASTLDNGNFTHASMAWLTFYDENRGENSEHHGFFSPSESVGRVPSGISYVRVTSYNYQIGYSHDTQQTNRAAGNRDFYTLSKEVNVADRENIAAEVASFEEFDRVVGLDKNVRLDALAVYREPGQTEVMNWTFSQKLTYLRLNRRLKRNPLGRSRTGVSVPGSQNSRTYNYTRIVTLKRFIPEAFGSLEGLRYQPLHSEVKRINSSSTVFGGGAVVTEAERFTIFQQGYESGIRDIILIGLAAIAAVVISVVSLGTLTPLAAALVIGATAAGVTIAAVTTMTKELEDNGRFAQFLPDNDEDFDIPGGLAQLGSGFQTYVAERLRGAYVDSSVSMGLAHGGFTTCDAVYKGSTLQDLQQFAFYKIAYWDSEEQKYLPKPVVCPSPWQWNDDFDASWPYGYAEALDHDWDFGRDCMELPDGVAASQPGLPGSRENGMRVFLPLNVVVAGERDGVGRSLVTDGQRLFVCSVGGIRVYDMRAREIQTNAETLYLGNGDLLDRPSLLLSSTDGSAVACGSLRGWCTTPWGIFFFDSRTGSLYNVTGKGGARDITEGVREHLRNASLLIGDRFDPDIRGDYLLGLGDAPNAPNGEGAHVWYDDRAERLMLTLKAVGNGAEQTVSGTVCDGVVSAYDTQSESESAALLADGFTLINESPCRRLYSKLEVIDSQDPVQKNVYIFYDITSQSFADVQATDQYLMGTPGNPGYFDRYRAANPTWQGEVYTYPVFAQERWVALGAYPWFGTMPRETANDPNTNQPYDNAFLPPNLINGAGANFSAFYRPHPAVDPATGLMAGGAVLGDRNPVVLTFFDESAPLGFSNTSDPAEYSPFGYHPYQFSGTAPGNWDGQPRPWYLEDYARMRQAFSRYDSFRGVCYPVVRDGAGPLEFPVHALAAIEGRVLAQGELPTNALADFTRVTQSNPYSLAEGGPGPLRNLGWEGVFDKVSPIGNLLNDASIGADLDALFELTMVEVLTYAEVRPNPVPTVNVEASVTLSWSPKQGWISTHGYHPSHVLQDAKGFIAYDHGNTGWRHHDANANRLQFFGDRMPFVVAYAFNRQAVAKADAVTYVTRADRDDGGYVEDTFDRYAVYGVHESTGDRSLEAFDETDPFASVDWTSGVDYYVLHDRVYGVARLVNRATAAESVDQSDAAYRGLGTTGRQGYGGPSVPRVLNSTGDFGTGRMTERMFIVRLERRASPTNDDLRIVFDLGSVRPDPKTHLT